MFSEDIHKNCIFLETFANRETMRDCIYFIKIISWEKGLINISKKEETIIFIPLIKHDSEEIFLPTYLEIK